MNCLLMNIRRSIEMLKAAMLHIMIGVKLLIYIYIHFHIGISTIINCIHIILSSLNIVW